MKRNIFNRVRGQLIFRPSVFVDQLFNTHTMEDEDSILVTKKELKTLVYYVCKITREEVGKDFLKKYKNSGS